MLAARGDIGLSEAICDGRVKSWPVIINVKCDCVLAPFARQGDLVFGKINGVFDKVFQRVNEFGLTF